MGSSCVSPCYVQGRLPQGLWVPGAVGGLRALPRLLPGWVSGLALQERDWIPGPRLPFCSSAVAEVGRCGTAKGRHLWEGEGDMGYI